MPLLGALRRQVDFPPHTPFTPIWATPALTSRWRVPESIVTIDGHLRAHSVRWWMEVLPLITCMKASAIVNDLCPEVLC